MSAASLTDADLVVPRADADPPADTPGGIDLPFRGDIEGLRAVAVVLVVLYHAHVRYFSGGFIGVDVFFVISGFLITGLLLREQSFRGRISIAGFYARRARRILPAAAVVIVGALIWAHVETNAFTYLQYNGDARFAALFSANLHFAWQQTNYFIAQGGNYAPPMLLHYWSLAVEEQFYLVWPTLVLVAGLLVRRWPLRHKVLAIATAASVVSFVYSVHLTHTSETWAFYSPFSRAWELGLGAMLAAVAPTLAKLPRGLGLVVGWLGLGAVALAAAVANPTFFPGVSALLPVLGAGAVIAGGACATGAGLVLALPPLRAVGRVSYGWYLLHYPPMILLSGALPADNLPVHDRLEIAAATLGAAFVMYYVMERPIRRSRALAARPWLSIAMGLALVGGAFVFATLYQKGF